MKHLPPKPTMLRAFRQKDRAFDGLFYVGITTTGIFCRPTCRAKPAKESNMQFFQTPAQALSQGFRPCHLCRPLDPLSGPHTTPSKIVQQLLSWLDTPSNANSRLTEADLRARGIDPTTARRQFRRHCQMTFAAYQRARRMGTALKQIRHGHSVLNSQLDAGYASGSAFRQAFQRLFKTAPHAAKTAGISHLHAQWIPTPLSPMIALCNDAGILLNDFVDRPGLKTALTQLRLRHGTVSPKSASKPKQTIPAAILPSNHRHLQLLERELAEYFAGTRHHFTVPLQPHGTAFQQKAWGYLRTIPAGQTRTYQQQAAALGTPNATRAVGTANGKNYLEILIPCHRVIASTGQLAGYGGGLPRKRWLLNHESKNPNS